MKLAWKIFCIVYGVVMLTVGFGGFFLVESTTSLLIDSRAERAIAANTYAGQAFAEGADTGTQDQAALPRLQQQIGSMLALGADDKLTIRPAAEAIDDPMAVLQTGEQGVRFWEEGDRHWLQVALCVEVDGTVYRVDTMTDVSEVFIQRDRAFLRYRLTVIVVALISSVVLLVVSWRLTNPLRRLSRAANKIATGEYTKRLAVDPRTAGSAELRQLAMDFNTMAQAVEDKVRDLEREIDKRETFIADFTHELKTPMTSIIGYADLLRSYALNEGERREAADAVYREGRRLERLAMQLLDLLVLGKETVRLGAVGTDRLAAELRTSLRFVAEKYGVTVTVTLASASVRADLTLLVSLLYNLVDNACKASPAGERVQVIGTCGETHYTFAVIDHGRGIAPENQDRITDPFFMEDKSRSRKQGGAGLGLALGKRIAELHHTALRYESTPGKGTAVRFRLAYAREGVTT